MPAPVSGFPRSFVRLCSVCFGLALCSPCVCLVWCSSCVCVCVCVCGLSLFPSSRVQTVFSPHGTLPGPLAPQLGGAVGAPWDATEEEEQLAHPGGLQVRVEGK